MKNNTNKILEFLLVIVMFLNFNTLRSQTYYGKNDLGKLEFINDSICELNFYHYIFAYSPLTNYCKYYKNGDTIFISSEYSSLYSIQIADSFLHSEKLLPIIGKIYRKNNKGEYKMQGELITKLDTTENSIIINNVFTHDLCNSIFVFYMYDCLYDVRCFISDSIKNNSSHRVNFKFYLYYKTGEIYLSDFPLLIKGNKLVPIDEDKQFKCWIENGFYFPTMVKSKKNKKHNTINYCFRALEGLNSNF